MKTRQSYLLAFFLSFSAGFVKAQNTQSAMYDAIALMNAKNGINAIFIGHPHGYDIIDPLGIKQPLLNKASTPDSFRNDNETSQKIIDSILRRNAHLSSTAPDSILANAYSKNPFLKDLFVENKTNFIITKNPGLETLNGFTTSELSRGIPSNISGNIVNGVADFLIKRAGEELSASIFTKLQAFINHYPEFNILFPKTSALLKPIDPYDYAKTLKAMKAAIQEDLDGLPVQLPQLYQLPRYQLLNKKVPELTLVFASAQLFSELHGKSSLSKSLHDLDTASCLKEQNNYSTMIHLTNIISNSMRKKLISDNEDGDYPYFNLQDIDMATHKDPGYTSQLGKFYLGLIWQQVSCYQIYDKDGAHQLSDLIGRYVNQTAAVVNQFVASSDKLSSLGQQLATLKQRDDALKGSGQNLVSADRFTLYNQLIVGIMQLLQPFVAGDATDHPWKQQLLSICVYWPQVSASGISMIKDISAKNYNLAITDLSSMLQNVRAYQQSMNANIATTKQLGNDLAAKVDVKVTAVTNQINQIDSTIKHLPKSDSITDVNTKTAVITQIQYLTQSRTSLQLQLRSLKWEKDNSKDALLSLSKLLSYFDLLASLSQAENSQEAETILENYALPAGSSRVKKDAAFNILTNVFLSY